MVSKELLGRLALALLVLIGPTWAALASATKSASWALALLIGATSAFAAGGTTPGTSHLNCSSSEPTIQAASTTIMCADFDRSRSITTNAIVDGKTINAAYNSGTFMVTQCGSSPPEAGGELFNPNTGWCGTDFGTPSVYAYGTTACGGAGNNPGGAAQGAAGTNCSASTRPPGQNPGSHNFPGTCVSPLTTLGVNCFNNSQTGVKEYDEVYYRFMVKVSSDWQFGSDGNQKLFTVNPSGFGAGGIILSGIGASGAGDQAGRLTSGGVMDSLAFETGYVNPQNPANCGNNGSYLCQNTGAPILNIVSPRNEWYAFEMHIKLNGNNNERNGILEIWADNCGPTGSTCPATPTKRWNYTNVAFRGQGAVFCNFCDPNGFPMNGDSRNAHIGAFFLDWDTCCANASTGQLYFDQIVVSTQRIGWIGATAPGGPPNAPSNLRRVFLDWFFARLSGSIPGGI